MVSRQDPTQLGNNPKYFLLDRSFSYFSGFNSIGKGK